MLMPLRVGSHETRTSTIRSSTSMNMRPSMGLRSLGERPAFMRILVSALRISGPVRVWVCRSLPSTRMRTIAPSSASSIWISEAPIRAALLNISFSSATTFSSPVWVEMNSVGSRLAVIRSLPAPGGGR